MVDTVTHIFFKKPLPTHALHNTDSGVAWHTVVIPYMVRLVWHGTPLSYHICQTGVAWYTVVIPYMVRLFDTRSYKYQ